MLLQKVWEVINFLFNVGNKLMYFALKFIPLIILFTFLCSLAYTRIYQIVRGYNDVPKGFGSFVSIIFFISIYIYKSDYYISLFLPSLIIIVLMTLIYFLDDLFELSPFIRMIITSITTSIILNMPIGFDFLNMFPSLYLIVFSILMISSIVLVNVSNFYDGSNLNLSSLIFLIGCILIIFNNQDLRAYDIIGSSFLGISIGFSILNCRPNYIYIGDSGSFLFAFLFLTLVMSSYVISPAIFFALFALIALPVFDVFYVICLRIKCSHDLLIRNYLHLYQRMEICHQNYSYLLPVPINLVVVLFSRYILRNFINDSLAMYGSIIFITPINYILLRYFFVEKEYFFGDGIKHED